MNRTIASALRGSVVEEEVELTTVELGRACRTTAHQIEVWVSEGVLQPSGETREAWRFRGDSLARMRLATRLMHDLEIAFNPHPLFRVDGADVTVDLPLAPWEAALGATVDVPTPEGTVQLTVPKGSAAGRKLRLKGRGLPGKNPGDLYAAVSVVAPKADSDAARAAYENLAKAFPNFQPRAQSQQ